MALPDLVLTMPSTAFIYGLKPWLKGFVKAQAQAMTDASLNEVMTVAEAGGECTVRILDAMTL